MYGYRTTHNHICGCYYLVPLINANPSRTYLPQVDVKAHTIILSTTSRTTLTQKFAVPSQHKGIKKLRYTFPLYDGVSVVGFKCFINDRVIEGTVKEKHEAKREFDAAVQKGQVAGLLDQLPDAADVFTTTIGNVPPNASVIVEITYLGELKHDAEVDGVRFTIPTFISPRYGDYPATVLNDTSVSSRNGRFEVTVDAILDEGQAVREIRSPSHPIAVSMGVLSTDRDGTPALNQSSAYLSLGTTEMDKDFVLQVVSKEVGTPKALLETHPTLPGQRALMATLVPKFQLKTQRPEIVFVCDRSGSMGGPKIQALKQALTVFLKSMPVGVVFNICSFGSSYSFLWDNSKPYTQATMEEAMRHVSTFEANFGGTSMLEPIKASFGKRHKDRNMEVFLVTDGEIWDQDSLFAYLNEQIKDRKVPVRVFTLGVGSGVSHSLIEGVARCGNGFSQAVGENEKFDSKVVRMLKGALFPHISDYTIDIKYGQEDDDMDFEIIEKVIDSLKIHDEAAKKAEDAKPKPSAIKKVISLFDSKADIDKNVDLKNNGNQFEGLPDLPSPSLLQTPNEIPPLFPFNRTTVYLLLSPDHKGIPKSVILNGTTFEGPVQLEIPVQVLSQPGQSIHQLAAKKAMQELDEGHGWVQAAKINGKDIKSVYPSYLEELSRRESVRLGTTFQVAGKHVSFVAVEKASAPKPDFEFLDQAGTKIDSSKDVVDYDEDDEDEDDGGSFAEAEALPIAPVSASYRSRRAVLSHASAKSAAPPPPPLAAAPNTFGSFGQSSSFSSASGPSMFAQPSMFANPSVLPRPSPSIAPGGPPTLGGNAYSSFGAPTSASSAMASGTTFGMASTNAPFVRQDRDRMQSGRGGYSGSANLDMFSAGPETKKKTKSSVRGNYQFHDGARKGEILEAEKEEGSVVPAPGASDQEILDTLVRLQAFDGYWDFDQKLWSLLKVASKLPGLKSQAAVSDRSLTTALVIRWLEIKMAKEKDTWELIAEKAQDWLDNEIGDTQKEKVLAIVGAAL
jgi:hypothetical protein